MVIKSRRITFFILNFLLFFSTVSADLTFLYDEIVNKKSSLWGKLRHKTPAEIVAFLLGAQAKADVTITDVPGLKKGEKTTITMSMYQENALLRIFMNDSNDNNVIIGNFDPDKKSANLALLRSTPQRGSSVLGIGDQKRLISGTTALCLWDRLWELWGIKQGFLTDASMYEGFYLRMLLPYIYGHSWYGEFGYLPRGISQEKYQEAVSFLRNRIIDEIIKECAQVSHAQEALLQAVTRAELTAQHSLGHLVTVLYTSWRYGRSSATKPLLTMEARAKYKEALFTLYSLFLAEYPVNNEAVLTAQSLVNWATSLEKKI